MNQDMSFAHIGDQPGPSSDSNLHNIQFLGEGAKFKRNSINNFNSTPIRIEKESSSSQLRPKQSLYKEQNMKEPAFFERHQLAAEKVTCDKDSTEEEKETGFRRVGK